MRTLRVVGINEDGSVVLEDSGRRERFTVAADEQLRAAARGDLTRLGQIAIELESQLRPREIQARIRAGASVEQVAAAAGVPPQKIERFAYPVLLERSRTSELAQRAHPVRADGPDSRMLGDVIAHTFGMRGQEYTEAEWDSWKGEDGRWVVALSWRAGRSDNRAHWTFHPGAHGGTVTALDEHASDLVEGLPARPLRTVGPVIDIARQEEGPEPPRQPEELRAAASDNAVRSAGGMRVDAGRERQPAQRTGADQRVGSEQRAGSPPTQRQAEPRSETRAADSAGRAPDTRATDGRADARATETSNGDARTVEATPVDSRAGRSEQVGTSGRTSEPAAPTTEPAATENPAADAAGTANRRTKKGKPVMPSWDEVLLGVRGQR
jgi:Protein of unknown function (DUF3071)